MRNGKPTRRVKTLVAIHPNEGVRAWYREQIDELLRAAHSDLLTVLAPVMAHASTAPGAVRWIPPVATHGIVTDEHPGQWLIAMDAPLSARNIERILKSWGTRWQYRFDNTAAKIATKFAGKSFRMTETQMRAALKSAGFTVTFKPTSGSLDAYRGVIAENVGLIKSIPQRYLTDVQSAVWSSVNRGADMATLSTELRRNYGSTVNRAALIARDQNAKAKATIESTRRQELGIREAIWQHSSAGREPRPTHVAMDGKVFDLRKGMWDADEKQWILPGQLINCRCTSRAIIPQIGESAQ